MTRTTNFVWNPVSDCVRQELGGSNNVTVVYTNEPQPYGGVLSQRRGTTTHVLHADALGSTRTLTDSSQTITDTYLNDAWGNSVATTGTMENPYRWVGKYGYQTDSSTGQVYVRARMYQPTTARWISADPLLFVDGVNKYIYTHNIAVGAMDQSGLTCQGPYCGPDVDQIFVRELQYASQWFNKHISVWTTYPSFYWYEHWVRWKHMFTIGPQLNWENITSELFRDAQDHPMFCPF